MMRILMMCAMLLLFGCSNTEQAITDSRPANLSKQQYPDVKVSRLLYVIDGDTFVCDIDDLSSIAGKKISIRLRGINTPELRAKDKFVQMAAQEEKNRLSDILTNAKTIELKNIGRCKYFRILADVYADGENIIPKLNQEYIINY